jgi:hypothetical protein
MWPNKRFQWMADMLEQRRMRGGSPLKRQAFDGTTKRAE